MSDLTCPKCHSPMRRYERSGIDVDQCTECRGIFLDRGELERLVDAENTWHRQAAQPAPPPASPQYSGHGGYHGSSHHKRRKSFLEELFD